MREPYRDLYALFRHDPSAEEYFNSLPDHVQDRLSAQYRSIDTKERLMEYAGRAQSVTPVEEIGGRVYLPPPTWY